MKTRKEFTITKEQCDKLLDACKPVPYMIIGGMAPRSPQQNANDAWCELGRELGFDGMTVQPVAGKGMEVFTAEVVQLSEGQLVETYKGYAITVAPAHQRKYRFNFCHPDYDGPEDKRCGFATTEQGCREQIDELEDSTTEFTDEEITTAWLTEQFKVEPYCWKLTVEGYYISTTTSGYYRGRFDVFRVEEDGDETTIGQVTTQVQLKNMLHVIALAESVDVIRDNVLHERNQMAEAGFDSDKVNAVLGIIDDATGGL